MAIYVTQKPTQQNGHPRIGDTNKGLYILGVTGDMASQLTGASLVTADYGTIICLPFSEAYDQNYNMMVFNGTTWHVPA